MSKLLLDHFSQARDSSIGEVIQTLWDATVVGKPHPISWRLFLDGHAFLAQEAHRDIQRLITKLN